MFKSNIEIDNQNVGNIISDFNLHFLSHYYFYILTEKPLWFLAIDSNIYYSFEQLFIFTGEQNEALP